MFPLSKTHGMSPKSNSNGPESNLGSDKFNWFASATKLVSDAVNSVSDAVNSVLSGNLVAKNDVAKILNSLEREYASCHNSPTNEDFPKVGSKIRLILQHPQISNSEKLTFASKILAKIVSLDTDINSILSHDYFCIIYYEVKVAFVILARIIWMEKGSVKVEPLGEWYNANKEALETTCTNLFIEKFKTVIISHTNDTQAVTKLRVHSSSARFYAYFIHEFLYAVFKKGERMMNQPIDKESMTNVSAIGALEHTLFDRWDSLEEKTREAIIQDSEAFMERFAADTDDQESLYSKKADETAVLWMSFFEHNSPFRSYAREKSMTCFKTHLDTDDLELTTGDGFDVSGQTQDPQEATVKIKGTVYIVNESRDWVKNGDCALWAVLSATTEFYNKDRQDAEKDAASFRNAVISSATAHMSLVIAKDFTGEFTPRAISKCTQLISVIFGNKKEYFVAYLRLQIMDKLNLFKTENPNVADESKNESSLHDCEKELENAEILFASFLASDINRETVTSNTITENWPELEEPLLQLFFKYMPGLDCKEMLGNVRAENVIAYSEKAKKPGTYLTNHEIAVAMLMKGYVSAGFVIDLSDAQILIFKRLLPDDNPFTLYRYIKCNGAEGYGSGVSVNRDGLASGGHWIHVELTRR